MYQGLLYNVIVMHDTDKSVIREALDAMGYNPTSRVATGLIPLDNVEECKRIVEALRMPFWSDDDVVNKAESVLRDYWGMPKPEKDSAMATKKTKVAQDGRAKETRAKKSGIVKVGVIAEIVACASKDRGASKVEVVEHLSKKFPDRDPKAMGTTVSIQLGSGLKRKGYEIDKTKDEKRGLVYRVTSAPAA
jgi:hypothetical protein